DPVALTDINQYQSVVAHNVYDGIDVVWQASQNNLRFDFNINPGADISQIALRYSGPQALRVDQQGRLNLSTPSGEVQQDAPVLWQMQDGAKRAVTGSYVQREDGSIGFQVEQYSPNSTLVIDPTVSFSSYLG